MTQVNWKQFINVCHETVGYSPTRGLDACASPTHKDPAAFLACIDLQNKPLEALRHGRQRGLFRHFFFSFAFTLDPSSLLSLHQFTHLAIFSERSQMSDHLFIASGSMEEWHDAVLLLCKPFICHELRATANIIYDMFLNMGFRTAFPLPKTKEQDGTFTV